MKLRLNDAEFVIDANNVSLDHFAIAINDEQEFENVINVLFGNNSFSNVEVISDDDKVMSHFTNMVNANGGYFIENIDNVPHVVLSIRPKSDSDRIAEMESEMKMLRTSKEELEAQNEMLTECILELGNVIYA